METETSFTTVMGRIVKCKPVNDTLVTMAFAKIEKDFRARGEPLDPPTYTVQIALAGAQVGTETHPHDETTLEVPGDEAQTAANKLAWANYQAARERLTKAQYEKREWLWLMVGLDVELPAEDDWAREQEALFEITVPTDPQARRLHYIKTVVLSTLVDFTRALETVTLLSYTGMVDPEVVRASIDSFRNKVQREATARTQAGPEPLAAQPKV